jgi:chromosome segregation ATPase
VINPDINEKSKREEILDLISEKGSHLVLEQVKALLESRTDKMQEELHYLMDRLSRISLKFERTVGSVKETEPGVIKSTNMLNDYKKERDALAKETEKLKGIREKVFRMSERKSLIENKTETVGILLEKQKTLEGKYRDNLNTKVRIGEELKANKAVRDRVNEDIGILKDKKNKFVSKMPEYSSPNELKEKQDRAEKDVKQYTADITKTKKQLNNVNKEISILKKQADKKTNEKDALIARKNALQEKISELEVVEDREALSAEVKDLKGRKDFLSEDIESKKVEEKHLASKIPKVEKSAEKEREFESTADEILEELRVQKGEIDNAENVIKMINLNIAVNGKFQEIVNSITEYLEPLNKSLGALAKDYKKVLNEPGKTIRKGLK